MRSAITKVFFLMALFSLINCSTKTEDNTLSSDNEGSDIDQQGKGSVIQADGVTYSSLVFQYREFYMNETKKDEEGKRDLYLKKHCDIYENGVVKYSGYFGISVGDFASATERSHTSEIATTASISSHDQFVRLVRDKVDRLVKVSDYSSPIMLPEPMKENFYVESAPRQDFQIGILYLGVSATQTSSRAYFYTEGKIENLEMKPVEETRQIREYVDRNCK